jgi:thymidylate synthase
MSKGDIIYGQVIQDIAEFGQWDVDAPVRTRWKDGTPTHTKSILNVQMKFYNGEEIPILTQNQKRVPSKDPINEMDWTPYHFENVKDNVDFKIVKYKKVKGLLYHG